MDDRWGDTGSWVGDDLRREVFFFASGGEQLYGSIYAPAAPPTGAGVAICNSWGYEANQADQPMQRLALERARAGGVGLIFHYPGFGDSQGDLAAASMEALARAAVDAVEEGSRRLPGMRWTLAGLMLGASVAALAASPAAVDRLLLIQPALRPSIYFARLERSAKRAAVRVPARAGNAYGYPVPRRILEGGATSDAAVAGALGEFGGEGVVVRYAEPAADEAVPAGFEDVVVPGTWRFGARQRADLALAAERWMRGVDREAAR
jgi:hypothetical protein